MKALETTVAQLEAIFNYLAKKGETASSSHGSKSSSIVLADHHSLRIKPETFSAASEKNWLMWLRKFLAE